MDACLPCHAHCLAALANCTARQRSQLIGRVSMDMLTVDLTELPGSGLGSEGTLWGEGLNASEVAAWADSIPYQLFCNLNRVPRHYCD